MRDLTLAEVRAMKVGAAVDALAWCAKELPTPRERAHARRLLKDVQKLAGGGA